MAMRVNADVINEVTSFSKKNFGDDEGTLPGSKGTVLDRAGVQATGYIDKKGTPYGLTAFFNMLPPGTNIEDQKVADVSRELRMTYFNGKLGFDADGW